MCVFSAVRGLFIFLLAVLVSSELSAVSSSVHCSKDNMEPVPSSALGLCSW